MPHEKLTFYFSYRFALSRSKIVKGPNDPAKNHYRPMKTKINTSLLTGKHQVDKGTNAMPAGETLNYPFCFLCRFSLEYSPGEN